MATPGSDTLAPQDPHHRLKLVVHSSTSDYHDSHPCTTTKRSDQTSNPPRRSPSSSRQESPREGHTIRPGILLTSVYSPEKVRRVSSGNRSQEVEPVHQMPSLQDGVGQIDQGTAESGRMDDEHRPHRCISSYPAGLQASEVLQAEHPGGDLSVPFNVLWPEYCPQGVHQTARTSGRLSQIQGYPSSSLSGRLAVPGRVARDSDPPHHIGSTTFQQTGLDGQHQEVGPDTSEAVCVHWYGPRSGAGTGQTYTRRSPEDLQSGVFSESLPVCSYSSLTLSPGSTQPCLSVCYSGQTAYSASAVLRQGEDSGSEGIHHQVRVHPPGKSVSHSTAVVGESGLPSSRRPHPCCPYDCYSQHRCQYGRLGCIFGRPQSFREVVSEGAVSSHHSTGAESSPSSSSGLCRQTSRPVSATAVRQHNSSCIHQEPGRYPVSVSFPGSQGPSGLVSSASGDSSSLLPPGSSELFSRSSLSKIAGPRNGVDPTPCDLREDSTTGTGPVSGPICYPSECPAANVRQSLPRSRSMAGRRIFNRLERDDSICLSSNETHPRGAEEAAELRDSTVPGSPSVAQPILVSGSAEPTLRPASLPSQVAPSAEATPDRGLSPESRTPVTSRVASVRDHLRQAGFSAKVARYAAAPQRPSSLRLYESHWRCFSSWCEERDVDPSSTSVHQIADFLVFLFEVRKLAPRTIANYRTSIASTLGSVDGVPLSLHPCLSKLIKAFSNTRSVERPRVPEWDLSRVLRVLRSPDFEPPSWGSQQERMRCTWKTVFLLALASTSRRSELQALSRDPRDLIFSDSGMSLRVVPGFLAKTAIPGLDPEPFFVPALTPFSCNDTADRLLCPVRMVRRYVNLSGGPSPKSRLFRKVRGDGAPSSQTVANWIKACVRFAHQHRPDLHVTAHEVRRMSASWAYHGGVHSMDEIMQAGTWASSNTFTSFYLADVRLQPDGRYRMQPVIARKQVKKF